MMVWRGGLPGVSPGFLVVWLSGDHIISTVGLPCKYACRDALAGERKPDARENDKSRKWKRRERERDREVSATKLCFRSDG